MGAQAERAAGRPREPDRAPLRPDGHELRVGSAVELTATRPYVTDERVACGIPGYHIPGQELYADRLAVDDDPFAWDLEGNCAFASTFSYSSGS